MKVYMQKKILSSAHLYPTLRLWLFKIYCDFHSQKQLCLNCTFSYTFVFVPLDNANIPWIFVMHISSIYEVDRFLKHMHNWKEPT